MAAWRSREYTPILLECFDRGGWFYGEFDGARMVGVVVLESSFIGARKDQLQLSPSMREPVILLSRTSAAFRI